MPSRLSQIRLAADDQGPELSDIFRASARKPAQNRPDIGPKPTQADPCVTAVAKRPSPLNAAEGRPVSQPSTVQYLQAPQVDADDGFVTG